ncbi:MAG: molybdopterin-dependent oxidoreductase [Desulfarculaceae bacterium]|nr:molybdopterin-dependent oxidoreductase [Desulfarculaceae bacterium]MCF8073062.1 molybdopterin-dependent oxidoreductase [Desulfarculaceae bacterium]MCF8101853.1 molybdopterin-dependent oxidoreductase [Desulfarculaceae bacterium]MCF8115380.1 molybdopterin-dependent oxidoreductase [Desulfarculaceae bacterium]
MKNPAIIGQSIPRLDAPSKVTGKAIYTDDMKLPGMLYGKLLRSPLAHARIKRIDVSKAKALPGVKDVIVGADTPGVKYGNWRLVPQSQDELPLAVDKVRFVGDEVAAVCALDPETAEKALGLIEVEYEELPAILSVEEATAEGAGLIHQESKGNVSLVRKIDYGDLDQMFAKADYVREDTFRVHPVQHAYMEPCSSLAQTEEGNRVTLWTSTQTPYIVQCLLASTLGLPENNVRVMKVQIGGGFGGKMELRPWEFCAAFMSLRTGRPVKFTLTRHDELAYGRRRHPMTIYSKVGFKKDGMLLAKDFQVMLDGGAYNAMGPTATFLCGTFGNMLYNYPAYRYFGRHVYTNKPPASAMRGFGAPQAAFAAETQMNMAAEELGIDPIDIRLMNAMQTGDVIPDVATISSCGFKESLEEVRRISGWDQKRKNKTPGKGLGIGCFSFISGGVFNWFNTKYNFSAAEVKVFEDGTAQLAVMACDIGQGPDTVLRQILAAELGIPIHKIRLISMDTACTPKADLGTWGSRVTLMNGNAIIEAAGKIKAMLRPVMFSELDLNQIHDLAFEDERVFVRANPKKGMDFAECVYKALRGREGEPLTARGYYTPRNKGLVSPAFSFGAQVAEVAVDQDTGQIQVEKMYTAHDCGVAINKMSVEGQLEGAIQMGLGYALMEDLVMDDQGRTLNTTFLDYKMPAAEDMPPGESVEIETYEPEGPFGAKEAGEGLAIPTAPAISHAVFEAVGYRCMETPITPEKVLRALGKIK